MSVELLGLVWPLQLPAAQKVVMLAVADRTHRDSDGTMPALATLARDTCLSVRTVREALRGLEVAGLIFTRLRTGQSSFYVPNVDMLEDLHAQRRAARRAAMELPAEAPKPPHNQAAEPVCNNDTPAVSAGVPRRDLPGGAAVSAGDPGKCRRLTSNTLNTNTPHTPLAAPGGLASPAVGSDVGKVSAITKGRPMLGMAAWMAEVKARGEDAVPADDPVFAYAETVGLPRELVALCWREFKRRQLASGKRQKDWRRTFRNCVEANWYGLWWMRAGEPAQLSSQGEQVRRFFEAEDAAGAVVLAAANAVDATAGESKA